MVIDKKEHQAFLLKLIEQTQFPGQFLEIAYEIKQAIKAAEVKEKETMQ